MSREGPVPLSADLERFLEAIGVPQVSQLVRLHKAWPGIVGPLLTGKAFPRQFRNGILTVGVRNHSWAQELQLAKPALLSGIRDALGQDFPVSDLRFQVEPPEPVVPESPHENAVKADPLPPVPDPEGLAAVSDERTRLSLRAIHRRAMSGDTLPP